METKTANKISPFTVFILSQPLLWLAIILRPFVNVEAVQNYINWLTPAFSWLALPKITIDPSYVILTILIIFLTAVPFYYGLACVKEQTILSKFFLIWIIIMTTIVLFLPFLWVITGFDKSLPLINSESSNKGIFYLPEFLLSTISFSFFSISFSFDFVVLYYSFLFYPFVIAYIELGLRKINPETPFLIGSSIVLLISILGNGIFSLSDLPPETVSDVLLGYAPIMVVISAFFYLIGFLISSFFQEIHFFQVK
ncbi:MAG: hypothetical protein ACTSYA_10280 [Candidatus Kariarchaeaceae archaeon]